MKVFRRAAALVIAVLSLAQGSCSAGGSNAGPSDNQAGASVGGGGAAPSGGAGGTSGSGGAGGTPPTIDHVVQTSQICAAMGGPRGLTILARGDGAAATAADPLNPFKFDYYGRHGSVLYQVLTDPCIGVHFAHLLEKGREKQLEHFAQCLAIFVQSAANCTFYEGAVDSAGERCKDLREAHAGARISDADYSAFVMDVAVAIDAGPANLKGDSDGPAMYTFSRFDTEDLREQIVTNFATRGHSRPSAACEAVVPDESQGGAAGAGGAP